MSIQLPEPVAHYVAANARLDLEGMLQPFTRDAVILDNGKRFEGQAGLRALFEQMVIPVRAIFTPDTARQDGDMFVVEGPAHGDFKGSPLRFTYRFTLANDAIQAVEITG